MLRTLTKGLLAVLLVVGALNAHAATATPLEVSGWLPYWRAATSTADALVHLDSFTEINPFAYSVRSDGTLADTMKIDEGPWPALIAAAKAKKVRVIPTVMWGNGAQMHAILSNTKKRIALEDEIANLVKAKGFDGIDIDFEGKYAETKDYFSTFLKGLYMRMGNKWVMCAIESRTPIDSRYLGTPPADAGVYANDYVAINKYCDRVKIMAYDQGAIDQRLNDKAQGPYVPVADTAWVEKVVNLTAKTISKKKIMIGIPTYGYEYIGSVLQYGYSYDMQWAFNQKYALELAAALGITPLRTESGEIGFVYDAKAPMPNSTADIMNDPGLSNNTALASSSFTQTTGTIAAIPTTKPEFHILWWSDAKAIADKVALAKKLGVRGVAIFKIDGGEDPAMWASFPPLR